MLDRSWTRRIVLAAAAGGVALVLAAAPFAPGAALAKGASENGADNSGGRAGGNGNGNGGLGGQGGSASGGAIGNAGIGSENGPGNGHGLALGHDNDAVSGVDLGTNEFHPVNHGALASMLGSLNAGHAIANGNTNDNLNSKVGQIRAYMEAFEAYVTISSETDPDPDPEDVEDALEAAAEALTDAWNKDSATMTSAEIESVVTGVNDLVGDTVEETTPAEHDVANQISPHVHSEEEEEEEEEEEG